MTRKEIASGGIRVILPMHVRGNTTYIFYLYCTEYDQFDGCDESNLLHLDGSFSFLRMEGKGWWLYNPTSLEVSIVS